MDVASTRPWQQGEAPAGELTLDYLATTYLERVHRFAVMVSPPDADPDDLAQQAMLMAMENLHRFDPQRGSLDAWLWTIVHNIARDSGRAIRRRQLLFERLRSTRGFPSVSPETVALDRIRDENLIRAVRNLPARDRTIIALRFGAGLGIAEVADLLGTTRMAVAKAARRALDRLRTQVASLEDES